MRKVELLEVERASIIDLVGREIAENVIDYRKAREHLLKSIADYAFMEADSEDVTYWTERLHTLRQLKAKLEREETEGDDAVHQTEN